MPAHLLVTYGSTRGGTAGIAMILAEELRLQGFEVDLADASRARLEPHHDAVVIGGALYLGRWHRDARRFVSRYLPALRFLPVFLFSSGPLDDRARRGPIPPVRHVERIVRRVGALDHVTFGGRLLPDATGLMARAMAKEHAGDWRDPEHIRQWAVFVAGMISERGRSPR